MASREISSEEDVQVAQRVGWLALMGKPPSTIFGRADFSPRSTPRAGDAVLKVSVVCG